VIQPCFRPSSGASGQASELALLGESLVKIEYQSHPEAPILEISGSDSVRRAREACELLSRAYSFLNCCAAYQRLVMILKLADLLSILRNSLPAKIHQRRQNRFGVRLKGQIENLSQPA